MTSRIRYRNMIHFEANNPQLKSSRQQQMGLKKTNQHIVLSVCSKVPVRKLRLARNNEVELGRLRLTYPPGGPTMLAEPLSPETPMVLQQDRDVWHRPTPALVLPYALRQQQQQELITKDGVCVGWGGRVGEDGDSEVGYGLTSQSPWYFTMQQAITSHIAIMSSTVT